jgi:hypothetical protein
MVTSKSSVLKEPRLDFTIVTEDNLVERVTPNPAREEIEKIELNHDTYALDIETEAITKGASYHLEVLRGTPRIIGSPTVSFTKRLEAISGR